MRDDKDFNERLQELKEKYDGINDFDLSVVLHLEDEFMNVSTTNPDHTRRRRDILDMRHKILCNLRPKKSNLDI